MRAAVLHNLNDELVIRDDIELVEVPPGSVKVKIGATGVCHSDLSAMTGIIPQPTPFIPGHEGAGIITEVGDGVKSVAVGDKVIVAWSPPCGSCPYCTGRHQPNLCSEVQLNMMFAQNFLMDGNPTYGMAGAGTFAEEVVLVEQGVVKIDQDVPVEVASLVGCGVVTGVGAAINTAKITPGSSVVVFGCGGVGISCIQGARIAGAAEILAVDMIDSKLEDAKRFGATHVCKPDEVNSMKAAITGGDGFDFGLEAIGLPVTMRATYDAVRRGGTACIVGVGAQDQKVEFSAFELFYNEKNMVGSYYGGADVRYDFNRMLRLWKAGKLDLEGMISRTMALDEVNEAMRALKAGEVIRQVITF